MLTNQCRFRILGHRAIQSDVDSMDPNCTVRRSACDTVRSFEHYNRSDLSSLLESLPRFRSDVLLESHRVPNLDCSIFGPCREEELVGCDCDIDDWTSMFNEVSDEGSFRSRRSSFPRGERGTESSSTRNTGSDVRTEFRKRFSVRVEISTFEKLLDAWIVPVCDSSGVNHWRPLRMNDCEFTVCADKSLRKNNFSRCTPPQHSGSSPRPSNRVQLSTRCRCHFSFTSFPIPRIDIEQTHRIRRIFGDSRRNFRNFDSGQSDSRSSWRSLRSSRSGRIRESRS